MSTASVSGLLFRHRHCSETGHSQANCRKRNYCNYCKRPGHIISECRSKARNDSYRANFASFQPRPTAFYTYPQSGDASSVAPSSSAPNTNQLVHNILSRFVPTAIQSAFASLSVSGKNLPWFIDSTSFNHMTGNGNLFKTYSSVHNMAVEVASGQQIPVAGFSDITMKNLRLHDALHVPSLVPNLISVGQLTDNGCVVSFSPNGCSIQDLRTQQVIGTRSKAGRNFFLTNLADSSADSKTPVSCSFASSFSANHAHKTWDLWHARLGHPHFARLGYMFQNNLLPVRLSSKDVRMSDHYCNSCIGAKTSKLPFASSSTNITKPFDLVHSYLWVLLLFHLDLAFDIFPCL
ncbi:Retrovirus-related Pol polyprotein from transposon RE1 [Linum perenne]